MIYLTLHGLINQCCSCRPQAVLERFEKREYAVDGKAVVEYLRALVATDAIAGYIPDESKGRSSELSRLVSNRFSCSRLN